jgi:hypothetical protein
MTSDFKQLMTNADFIRELEFPRLTREKLALKLRPTTRGVEQIKKELRGERESANPRQQVREIADAYAKEIKSSASEIADASKRYFQRMWNHTYPEILDSVPNMRRWLHLSESSFDSRLNDHRCAWIMPWDGVPLDRVKLQLYPDDLYDRHNLPSRLRAHLESWTSGDSKKDNELRSAPYGLQVRIDRVQNDHQTNDCIIHLGQVKFWHYLATHASLSENRVQSKQLRHSIVKNALTDLIDGKECVLPSNFCLAMGVISSDGYAIFRKRRMEALHGGMWEYCVGEFMHGPDTPDKRFSAFVDGKPDMFAFCRAAVAEELDIDDVASREFKLFGFSVEYPTLAPKLMVLHYSKFDHKVFFDKMKGAQDPCIGYDACKVNPLELGKAISARPGEWTPTSKFSLWLTLMDSVSGHAKRKALNDEFDNEYFRIAE